MNDVKEQTKILERFCWGDLGGWDGIMQPSLGGKGIMFFTKCDKNV